MEEITVTTPLSQKAQLKQQIRGLEQEKSLLENDILSLKDRLEVIELERKSNILNDEIGSLQLEKTLLEEKVSSFSVGDATTNFSAPDEGSSPSEFEEVSTKLAEVTTEIQTAPIPEEHVEPTIAPVEEQVAETQAVEAPAVSEIDTPKDATAEAKASA